MKQPLFGLFLLAFGCAGEMNDEESAARTEARSDASSFVYATYVNRRPRVGELVELSLTTAEVNELPAPHYEGHYELTENTRGGVQSSRGSFNVYAYRGQRWIRFVDEEGYYGTSFEKYSWEYRDGILALTGVGSQREFLMRPSDRDDSEPRGITCSMTRLDITPQGPDTIAATFSTREAIDWLDGGALDAFEANYSFGISYEGGQLDVSFFENTHVQDETGSLSCDVADANEEGVFCVEPIEVDQNLGSDNEREKIVHAFDFQCRVN